MAAVPAAASQAFLKNVAWSHRPSDYVAMGSDAAASRAKPLLAPLVCRRKLNEAASKKLTSHYTFLLNPATKYLPGDSLGVYPLHGSELVSKTLAALGLDRHTPVAHRRVQSGAEMPAAMIIAQHLDIRNVPPALAKLSTEPSLVALRSDRKKYLEHIKSMELHDFASKYLKNVPHDKVIAALKPLEPRLYSISSNQAVAGNTVDLTVAKVTYETNGVTRHGAATHYLHHVPLGDSMTPVFIQKAPKFRPPPTATPAIMVGPGTGIAPFRSFLQEPARLAPGARNWLFFGDQTPADYLYKQEWEPLEQAGVLKVSTAFSRDPATKKTYVQDKIREGSAEVWDWIHNKNANFYICGDAKSMAPGVEQALKDAFQKHGNMSKEEAAAYLKNLEKQHRFHKDVY
ncbi:Sulfite reductase flavoprotein alpha-component [Diplonema papillatum]|nr:Sulfite reductase flavoprotein alpha-component [Diplonema papillatum]